MDGDDDDWWTSNEEMLDILCREAEVTASRNPSNTPAPSTSASCPPPTSAASAAPLSRAPAASSHPSSSVGSCHPASSAASAAPLFRAPAASAAPLSRIPAAPPHAAATSPFTPCSHIPASAPVCFWPPRELSQRVPDSGCGGFSPPREFSQRSAAEESDCQITGVMGPDRLRSMPRESDGGRAPSQSQAHGDRIKTVPPPQPQRARYARAAREKDSKSAEEELRRQLERALKQNNDWENKCAELKKGIKEKDLEIQAKEAEIHNFKKANEGRASKDICSTGMDIDQSYHTPANEALHAGGSGWTSTKRTEKLNGKNKELCSSRDGLEQKHQTVINYRTSTSGGVPLEESAHPELERNKCKDVKTKGLQTDLPLNSGHLERKKVLMNNISSNLCAIWGRPANSMLGRSLISKILVSCSEEMATLFQFTRSSDKCGTSTEASSSMNNAFEE